jgi:hypothetical protein
MFFPLAVAAATLRATLLTAQGTLGPFSAALHTYSGGTYRALERLREYLQYSCVPAPEAHRPAAAYLLPDC